MMLKSSQCSTATMRKPLVIMVVLTAVVLIVLTSTSSSTKIDDNRKLRHLLQQVSAFTTTSAARRTNHHRHCPSSSSLPQQHHPRRQLQALITADADNNEDENTNNNNDSQGQYNDENNSSDGSFMSGFSSNDSDDRSQQEKSEEEKIRNALPLFEMYNRMNSTPSPSSSSSSSSSSPSASSSSLSSDRRPVPSKTDSESTTRTTSSTTSGKKDDAIIVTEDTIKSLFVLFNSALATGVAKIVAKRYADDAVLLPCTSEGPRMTPQEIEDYYEQYLMEKPQKIVLEDNDSRRIRIGHDKRWAEDTGICEITFRAPRDGSTVPRRAKARYSFVYAYDSSVGQWKIIHHHSSLLDSSSSSEEGTTEPRPTGQFPVSNQKSNVPSSWSGPMTVERVQNLFQLLIQDTWAIGDADAAASRFHRDEGMLVPLNVYDRPRMGYDDIRDYFDEFLYDVRPVISKIERTVITLNDESKEKQQWAKDVGTMQVTFRKDYSTMDVRYSVDYILDDLDGQWKILQFHMTPLPKDWHKLRIPQQSNRRRNLDPSMDYEDTISTSTTSQSNTVPPSSSSFSASTQGATAGASVPTPIVTETDVHNWFEEWNAALATGDVNAVANRYGEKAILVPSLSYSNPRTTPAAIKEYYQVFLWSRPQATVVQRHVTISEHFVKDVGVLEYSFKNRPETERVKERYSFLYLFDAVGGWKIMHHQQSVVTEELQEAGTRGDGGDPSFFQ